MIGHDIRPQFVLMHGCMRELERMRNYFKLKQYFCRPVVYSDYLQYVLQLILRITCVILFLMLKM